MKKYFTNKLQNLIAHFQITFGHPFQSKPKLPNTQRFVNRKGWGVIEEVLEQIHTLSNDEVEFNKYVSQLQEALIVAAKKQEKKPFIKDEKEKLKHLADGLGDEMYFLLGDCVECGIDIEPIVEIIQNSNMSKLFTDEKGNKYAKQNELGKIIKSPDFFAPEDKIGEEIERQSK